MVFLLLSSGFLLFPEKSLGDRGVDVEFTLIGILGIYQIFLFLFSSLSP